MAKRYGLIISEKSKVIARPSIFNEDSDSDTDKDKPTGITILKKQERLAQAKLIAEDPTVYQYDELYDDMQSQRKESKLARKDLDKKPKYINKLLETAERRKKENERRIERQIQKEREAEGDMFKDKESFVTTGYRKKLEELKALEEMEKREEYLESIGDVRKQGDLSGFYRHLYEQTVDDKDIEDKKPEGMKKDIIEEGKSNEVSTEKSDEAACSGNPKENKKRKYRKRESSKSSDSEANEEIKLEHLPSNIDADSDFSIDSDSDSESEPKKVKTEEMGSTTTANKENVLSSEVKIETKEETNSDNKEECNEKDGTKLIDKKEEVTEPIIPKIDIWKKRTVGEVFDEALKRYYERKAARSRT